MKIMIDFAKPDLALYEVVLKLANYGKVFGTGKL